MAVELDFVERSYRDERIAAAVYRDLAEIADDDREELFLDLAQTEARHAEHWAALLREAGHEPPEPKQPRRVRLLLWWARRRGIDAVLPGLVRAEAAGR